MGVYGGPNKVKGGIVFSLDGANPASYAGDVDGATRSATAPAGTPYGYFGGGTKPPAYSTVDRVDYSNDTPTASTKGPLNVNRFGLGATGNLSYGWFGGGGSPAAERSSVDRVDYSSDTSTASARGGFSVPRYGSGATGNASYGYFAGGYAPSTVSSIDRIDYSNDSPTAVVKGPLTATAVYKSATGNTSYGYFATGSPSINSSKVERVDYSNDTATAVEKGPLSSIRYWNAATGNGSYGYWGGDGPYAGSTLIDRVDYSSDTSTALARGPLATKQSLNAATGNTSYGYFGGGSGNSPGSTADISNVDRLDYSSDTTTAVAKGPLTQVKSVLAAASPQANSLGASTIYPWYDTSGKGNTANITDSRFRATDGGYFTFDGTGDYLTVPSTTDFAFGTGDFTVEYWVKTTSTPQGTDYGYFGAGHPGPVSTVDRVDYSNDTATASTKGPLSVARRVPGATGNASYGYWGGGYSTGLESTVDRVDYSNDTATAAGKGPLSSAKSSIAAAGNKDYGYWGGGQDSPISTVDRVDYGNDTATATVKGPLSSIRRAIGATGNADYGYWAGGAAPSARSTVDRVDYSNDTATAAAKGPLTVARYGMGAAGNANYGWFAGGHPGPKSTVDRVDYSNDTPTASPKGPLSVAKRQFAATGNASYGYFGGGKTPSTVSSVDRIDYSNDTATAAAKGPLSSTRYNMAGASSRANGLPTTDVITAANIISPDSEKGSGYWAHQYDTTFDWSSSYGDGSPVGTDYGYFGGGNAPNGIRSIIERLDFSSDTPAMSQRSYIVSSNAQGMDRLAAVSSQSYAYFGGGEGGPGGGYRSDVSRLDYASDSTTCVLKGYLSVGRRQLSATGNTAYGYFGGGDSPSAPATYSTVDRVTYTNDTATATPKGPLTAAKYQVGSTGTTSYGYWVGGGAPSAVSIIDRVDYSNDTATASPKGNLTNARYGTAGTGNASYGWFGGGWPVWMSLVDRIDYSNDTATASARGNLNNATQLIGATGNTSYGYFAGGTAEPGRLSSVDRVDYSSDSPTATAKGPLSQARYGVAGASSRQYGFPTTAVNTELYTCSLSPVNDGSWHHVVMTRKSGTQQTYYDGVGITTTAGTYTDGTDYSGVDGWYIGKGSVGVSTFSGDLANITIRKGKGLSSDEVQQNFNALRSRFGV